MPTGTATPRVDGTRSAQPSAQDMKVAQRAQAMAADARMEVSRANAEELEEASEKLDMPTGDEAGVENRGGVAESPAIEEPAPSFSGASAGTISRLSVQA